MCQMGQHYIEQLRVYQVQLMQMILQPVLAEVLQSIITLQASLLLQEPIKQPKEQNLFK